MPNSDTPETDNHRSILTKNFSYAALAFAICVSLALAICTVVALFLAVLL